MAAEVKHTDRAHAVLSASSASRWLNCTPSARMAENLPNTSSVHADEGTLAHEMSENEIRYRIGIINVFKRNHNRLAHQAHKLYNLDMLAPIDDYVNHVMEQVAQAKALSEDALLLVEEKVSVEAYIPDGFGTCDFMAISAGILYITDLKFGKGVRVSAVDNSQLKLYGLGALDTYGMLYDIHTIRLTIVQPRLDAISTWDISADDLLQWGEMEVIPTAKTAFEGKGEHKAGDWCKFCPAKMHCPVLKAEALQFAKSDFDVKDPADDIIEVYKVADRVQSYLSAVQAHVLELAIGGKKWNGFKLVEGNGRRSISDEDKAMKVLKKAGFKESAYIKTTVKLEGLGALTKNLGKDSFEKLLGPLVVKSVGKPALVPESDKRDAINRASDFE